MKRIKFLFGAAFIMAVSSAFIGKASSSPKYITLWVQGSGAPPPCNSNTSCTKDTGTPCTDFYTTNACNVHYAGTLCRS